MFRVFLSALLGLSLLGSTSSAQTPKPSDPPAKDAPKDAKDKTPPKDKDAKSKDKTKDKSKDKAAAKKEVVGMFKSKDLTKKTLTITVDGKDKTYKITDDTKILGPRGGERDLKDDVLDKGYEITVVPNAKDDSIADEVKLPYRNDREGADKDKAKSKDDTKAKDKTKDKTKDDAKAKDKSKDDAKPKDKDKPQ
jgi:hypothetical protein